MAIAVGKKAPALALKDASGKVHSLKDYAGKDVIVYFYPKDDTPGCTKEAECFRDLTPDLTALGVVVLGVSPDDGPSHEGFARKYKLGFPLLSDPDLETMKAYEAYGEKTLYGKKTVGVIRSTVWIGPDGKVAKHWKRVTDAGEHPRHVLEAVRSAR